MNNLRVARACLLFGVGLNFVFLLETRVKIPPSWSDSFPFVSDPNLPQNNNSTLEAVNVRPNVVLEPSIQGHYSAWDSNEAWTTDSSEAVSIIVEMTGEFGNQLNHIAHGRAMQTMLWADHRIPSRLVFKRHSNDAKYFKTEKHLRKCFKNLRNLEVHGPKSTKVPSQNTIDRIQEEWLGDRANDLFVDRGSSFQTTVQSVEQLAAILQGDQAETFRNTKADFTSDKLMEISLPFLRTDAMINKEMMDRFYDDIRSFLEFDEAACCAEEAPAPDEAVFHFRNFVGELKNGKKTGLEELSPNKVASELFANSTFHKVAIATRFSERKITKEYFKAFTDRGFQAKGMPRNRADGAPPSAMQDFCSMTRASELVGMVRSTYVVWAALLGNPNGKARLYSVDSKWTRNKFERAGKPVFRSYNWSNPELKRRIHFELYSADE